MKLWVDFVMWKVCKEWVYDVIINYLVRIFCCGFVVNGVVIVNGGK